MLLRIVAIAFILIATSVAWVVLGATIDYRTHQSDDKLKTGVDSIWGAPQEQVPAIATYPRAVEQKQVSETDGHKTVKMESHIENVHLPLDTSRVDVALDLTPRQKGLLWYNTYTVNFAATYRFHNPTPDRQPVTYTLCLPTQHGVYDNLVMELDGKPLPIWSGQQTVNISADLGAGESATLRVAYGSRGVETWGYQLGSDSVQSRDFQLSARTNFRAIDFPLNTLSPTEKQEIPGGWRLTWRYTNLISGYKIGVAMPERLQPGPLAGQISYFAPVSLLLFFFVMFVICTVRSIDLHPMNYFFLAAAFFAFHLLLAYLADHVSIHWAFAICSLVSVALVVSYLRIVVGPRFALVEAGGAQFLYLVLFSYAFFFQGFTGLAVTVGCIVTLFVVMQATARIRWVDQFARPHRVL